MSETPEGAPHIMADMLDIPSSKRPVNIELIASDEEKLMSVLEGRKPKIDGIGFHCHSLVPVIDEYGAHEEGRCDYIVFDIAMIAQLKQFLKGITIKTKDGKDIDE